MESKGNTQKSLKVAEVITADSALDEFESFCGARRRNCAQQPSPAKRFLKSFILAPSCHTARRVSDRLIQWNTCSGVCPNIVSRWTQGCQRLSACRAGRAPGNGMEDHHGNLVGYSGLCAAGFRLSVTKHKTEGMQNYILWNLWSGVLFLIRKAIWEKIPVAQGFWFWWAALTSVAVLLGTGTEGCHSSAWRCLGSSPIHSSPPARWVVVCQESQEKGIISLHPCGNFVCLFSDTVMVTVLLFKNFSYQKKTFCWWVKLSV